MKAQDIQALTPKIYIQDDGTDYNTGEEFNGLWPLFGNIGHWRLNERKGVIGFNNKDRSIRNLYLSNIRWLIDNNGSYIRYRLPNNEPLPSPSVNQFIMAGTGGGFNEQRNFGQFLKSHGLSPHTINYQFDAWVGIERYPEPGEEEVFLYLHDTRVDTNFNRVLKYSLENVGGDLQFAIHIVNQNREGWTKLVSKSATDTIKQNFPGLHHIGFIYRSGLPSALQFKTLNQEAYLQYVKNVEEDGGEIIDKETTLAWFDGYNPPKKFITQDNPYTKNFKVIDPESAELISSADKEFSFYIDGLLYPPDNLAGIANMFRGAIAIDVNPFIGCQISTDNPTFSNIKISQNQQVKFNNHFTGKIYSMQWNNSIENPTAHRMSTLYNLRFNVPRGPQWVDFSDFEETRGKNLLKDLGRISQAIENRHGNFYVTLNRVRMRNN